MASWRDHDKFADDEFDSEYEDFEGTSDNVWEDEAFVDPDQYWLGSDPEDDGGLDDDGLGGVREPRDPLPGPSAGAIELPEPGTEGFTAH